MKMIRADSVHVEAYNEGLVVFLYDEAHTGRIRETAPDILEGFNYDIAADPKLAQLAADGVLVVFELEQDGELSIELAVGDPLTQEELGGGKWRTPQRARLHLPSGTLRIEGYNNLQFDPDPMDEEPAPRISVTPGDYVLTLHRSDVFAYEETETEPPFAWQVVTLTADSDFSDVTQGGMLLFPQ